MNNQTLTPHDMTLLPRGHQVSMTGDDWQSDRDRKAQAKAESERKKAALVCAKKLEAAADALNDFMRACNECADGGRVKNIDDGRIRLTENMMEYACWLNAVYEKQAQRAS